ncbi:serine hydrolase [Halobacterium wangiae]|uniref:serine hydrolase n=1 Tax=Halobacterium wangiae TaxID=2902623 RepID=UPI001E45A5DE|nr:serine hydrolase [Halobacterium wangiae]
MSRVDELDPETRDAVESFVSEWLADEHVPGASVALVDCAEPRSAEDASGEGRSSSHRSSGQSPREGGDQPRAGDHVVYADGFGARDLESNAPATPDTVFGVASVTKSFVATSVLRLVDEGHLSVDDPVTDYVPYFRDLDDPPTVHELLSHTSGMPSDGASVALISRFVGGDAATAPLSSDADVRRNVRDSLAERSDGERFFYYNTGYTVLGELVEAIDGRPFPEYVDDEVLGPLGMDRSVVRADPGDVADGMTPYRLDDGDLEETAFPVKGVGAAGGLLSTASDLAAYLQFAMHGDERVLPDDLLDLAQEPHATRQERVDGAANQYGYGWMRQPLLGDELVEHSGDLAVSSAYVGFLEDAGVGVAVLANTSPEVHPSFVGRALLALVRGEDPDDAVPFYALRAKCRRVAGRYESFRSAMTADVEATGGTLQATFETALGEESVTAFPESLDPTDHRFYTVDAGGNRQPLTFEETDEGLDCYYQRWRLHESDE